MLRGQVSTHRFSLCPPTRHSCLVISCIRENCHRLCRECDKVFHKSSSKRSHIRLCVPSTGEEGLLSLLESRLQSCVSPLTLHVLPRAASNAPQTIVACLFRDAFSACLLSSIGSIVAETLVRILFTPRSLTPLTCHALCRDLMRSVTSMRLQPSRC